MMKTYKLAPLFSSIFLGLSLVLVCPYVSANEVVSEAPLYSTREIAGLDWLEGKYGHKEALKRQKAEPGPFLMYFHNLENQERRDLFEAQVLNDPGFVAFVESFTRVAIDADENNSLAKVFDVTEFPSLLIMRTSASAQKVRMVEPLSDEEIERREAAEAAGEPIEEEEFAYDVGYILKRLQMAGLVPPADTDETVTS